jgi:hypothetical protein
MEPIFDVTPPPGACKVRLRIKSNRAGGRPVVTCDTLTQEAVQAALDASATLARYLSFQEKELGPKPWGLKAELQFLGSDGNPIDGPTEVEILYYGPVQAPAAAEPVAAVVAALKDIMVERERTMQAQMKEMGDLYRAAVNQSPNGELIKELATVRAEETKRANVVTKDFATLLQRQAKPPETDWTQKAANLAQFAPLVKTFFGPN